MFFFFSLFCFIFKNKDVFSIFTIMDSSFFFFLFYLFIHILILKTKNFFFKKNSNMFKSIILFENYLFRDNFFKNSVIFFLVYSFAIYLFLLLFLIKSNIFCTIYYCFSFLKINLLIIVIKLFIITIYSGIVFFFKDLENKNPEFFFFFTMSYISSMFLISSSNFIFFFLNLELFSLMMISMIVCDSSSSLVSQETASKYFVISSLASIIILISITFIYGIFGTFSFQVLSMLTNHEFMALSSWTFRIIVYISSGFMIFGLLLKLGVVPLHTWVLDIYEYLPMSVFLIFVSVSKIIFFYVVFEIFQNVFTGISFNSFFFYLGIYTILFASIGGISQTHIKNFLICASIFNSGTLFLVLNLFDWDTSGVFMVYLLFDCFFFLFMVIIFSSFKIDDLDIIYIQTLSDIDNYRHKLVISIFLICLSGLPPFALFYFKYGILQIISNSMAGLFWVGVILITTCLNFFNYIRLIKVMFFQEIIVSNEERINAVVKIKIKFQNSFSFYFWSIFLIELFSLFFFIDLSKIISLFFML